MGILITWGHIHCGWGLTADPIYRTMADSDLVVDLWSKSADTRGLKIMGSTHLCSTGSNKA